MNDCDDCPGGCGRLHAGAVRGAASAVFVTRAAVVVGAVPDDAELEHADATSAHEATIATAEPSVRNLMLPPGSNPSGA